jgi:hypothetical protein
MTRYLPTLFLVCLLTAPASPFQQPGSGSVDASSLRRVYEKPSKTQRQKAPQLPHPSPQPPSREKQYEQHNEQPEDLFRSAVSRRRGNIENRVRVGRLMIKEQGETIEYTSCSNSPFNFVMCGASIDRLMDLQGVSEVSDFIGLEGTNIYRRLENGCSVWLLTFEEEQEQLISATWENLLLLVWRESPQCAEKLAPHIRTLKEASREEIVELCGYDFRRPPASVCRRTNSFRAYANYADERLLGDARSFLYQVLRCRELFSGDGFARGKRGLKGAREFIAPRRKISSLKGARWVDLTRALRRKAAPHIDCHEA